MVAYTLAAFARKGAGMNFADAKRSEHYLSFTWKKTAAGRRFFVRRQYFGKQLLVAAMRRRPLFKRWIDNANGN
jgi:hypothetical protein